MGCCTGRPLDAMTSLAPAISQSRTILRAACPSRATHGERLLKSTLILIALAGLLGVPVAHAQSSATYIGLSKAHVRYMAAPDSEHWWSTYYDTPHCRRFGLGMMEDLGPRFHSHFVLETDPMSSTERRFGAMATMHAQQESRSADTVTFSMPPLSWC